MKIALAFDDEGKRKKKGAKISKYAIKRTIDGNYEETEEPPAPKSTPPRERGRQRFITAFPEKEKKPFDMEYSVSTILEFAAINADLVMLSERGETTDCVIFTGDRMQLEPFGQLLLEKPDDEPKLPNLENRLADYVNTYRIRSDLLYLGDDPGFNPISFQALMKHKLDVQGIEQSIFEGRGLVYRRTGARMEMDKVSSVSQSFEEFRDILRLLFAKRNSLFYKRAAYSSRYLSLLERLREHDGFLETFEFLLDDEVRKMFPMECEHWPEFAENDQNLTAKLVLLGVGKWQDDEDYPIVDDEQRILSLNPIYANQSLRRVHPELFWAVLDDMLSYGVFPLEDFYDKVGRIHLRKGRDEFRDWIRDLSYRHSLMGSTTGFPEGWPIPVRHSSAEHPLVRLVVKTESRYFLDNLIDDKECSTCVLGPSGDYSKVAMFYEADPHVGTMWLYLEMPQKEGWSRHGIGFAPFFECTTAEGRKVLLCDGVDAGVASGFFPEWKNVFYSGIYLAAKAAAKNNGYEELLFNLFVSNASSKEFNDYVRAVGDEVVMYVEKIAGHKPLEDAGFPDGSKHFIEALQYREDGSVGTMWSRDCKGLVHVVRVSLK